MALEVGTYLDDLVNTNPASTDGIGQADDHIRLIKKVLKNTFPNITGPVLGSQAELNLIDGLTSTTAELNKLDGYTGTVSDLNKIVATTATAAELNKLDGAVVTTAEINKLSGLNTTTGERHGHREEPVVHFALVPGVRQLVAPRAVVAHLAAVEDESVCARRLLDEQR